MECPEGGERESVQGRCEVGTDFQFPLINGEYISFSSLKINYSYGGPVAKILFLCRCLHSLLLKEAYR